MNRAFRHALRRGTKGPEEAPKGRTDTRTRSINSPVTIDAALAPVSTSQRARGSLELSSKRGHALNRFRQSGSIKALFPRGRKDALEAVFLNTAGGMTGGDRFDMHFEAGEGSRMVLSSQAAERVYSAMPGQVARLDTSLGIERGARLDWLAQETILFDRAALRRRLRIDMAADAAALVVEPVVIGRAAMGETVKEAWFDDRITLRRGGELVLTDAMRLSGNVDALMRRPGVGAGAGAFASVIFAAPRADLRLDAVRACLGPGSGASMVRDDVLMARLSAPDSFLLRRELVPALHALNGADLPRTWMI